MLLQLLQINAINRYEDIIRLLSLEVYSELQLRISCGNYGQKWNWNKATEIYNDLKENGYKILHLWIWDHVVFKTFKRPC